MVAVVATVSQVKELAQEAIQVAQLVGMEQINLEMVVVVAQVVVAIL